MNAGLIARRYATVLYDFATDAKEAERVYTDARNVSLSLSASEAAMQLMSSPMRKPSEKKALLEQVYGSYVCSTTMRFMTFVVDKGRAELLCEMLRVYGAVYRKRQGIKSACITTATELSTDKQQSFTTMLEAKTQSRVETTYKTDADIIGGIVVAIDGRQIDCSVKNQLKEIERKLMA